MRKSEREILGTQDKFETLMRCKSLTLALQDAGAPYAVPLNFGAELKGEELFLYFHCALEGRKLDLIKAHPQVGFCAYELRRVFNKGIAPCGYTADYESITGTGRAEIVTDEKERLHGLKVLMSHYASEEFSDAAFAPHALKLTCVVKITVGAWTGKRLIRP